LIRGASGRDFRGAGASPVAGSQHQAWKLETGVGPALPDSGTKYGST